jgi:hypothetical protein
LFPDFSEAAQDQAQPVGGLPVRAQEVLPLARRDLLQVTIL